MSNLKQDFQNMFDSFLEKECKIEQIKPKIILPTGIDVFDVILGGGFTTGSMSIIIGKPGCGKSTIGGGIIAKTQTTYDGNVISIYADSETSTSTERLAQLGVVNPLIKVREAKSVEMVFSIIEAACKYLDDNKNKEFAQKYPTIIVWDSIANTPTEKELKTDDVNQTIGLRARVLSGLLPKYISKLAEHNIALISINQLRDKVSIGPFAAASDLKYLTGTKEMPGGNSLKFNAFHIVELKEGSVLDKNSYGFNGIKVTAKCIKNKLFTPNIPISMVLNYQTGFDNFWTNYELLVDTKRIKSGAWSSLGNEKYKDFPKWNGKRGILEKLEKFPELKEAFNSEVKSALQDIIDEYGKYNLSSTNDESVENQIIEEISNEEQK